MRLIFILFFITSYWGCTNNPTEKHQSKRDNIINIKAKIKAIEFDNVLLHNLCGVYIFDKYLLIEDHKSYDYLIHLFDKNSFKYIASRVPLGQGPGEITNIGHIAYDKNNRRILINDHGKQRIFSYELDSLLNSTSYMPKVEAEMNEKEFPSWYYYINDTVCIGGIIKPTGNYGFNKVSAKWNMKTGEINFLKDLHPEIERKRYSIAVSLEQGIFVEFFHHHDLMCIRKLNGELVYNIYGQHWDTKTSNEFKYYGNALFCNDKIISTYVEGNNFQTDKNGQMQGVWPTKLIVFDCNGEYIKTLETDYNLNSFCFDKDNNRLILSMNDEIQFGYLELDGIID